LFIIVRGPNILIKMAKITQPNILVAKSMALKGNKVKQPIIVFCLSHCW